MATIDLAGRPGDGVNHVSKATNIRVPYLIGKEINLATAVTTKGSALAQGDVIEALDIPPNTMILAGGAKKTSAMTGTSTDLTFDIGITGGDVDNIVDGWDFDGTAVDSYATPLGIQGPVVVTTADTLDILFTTQTGTVTGGKVWVYAVVVDLRGEDQTPGIAALGS